MNKTLYWDIKTEVKMKRVVKNTKKSASKIIRMWVASPQFDAQVEELNKLMGTKF